MKEQIILIYDYIGYLEEKVEKLSKNGWRVVPGTTYIGTSTYVATPDTTHRTKEGLAYKTYFSIVMEREK